LKISKLLDPCKLLLSNNLLKIICKNNHTIPLNESKETLIDSILYETNEKLAAIAQEMKDIKFSKLDEKEKKEKMDILRRDFQNTLYEQQRWVLEITQG